MQKLQYGFFCSYGEAFARTGWDSFLSTQLSHLLSQAAIYVGGQAAASAAAQGPDGDTNCFAQPSMEVVAQPLPAAHLPTKVRCRAIHNTHAPLQSTVHNIYMHAHVTQYMSSHCIACCSCKHPALACLQAASKGSS